MECSTGPSQCFNVFPSDPVPVSITFIVREIRLNLLLGINQWQKLILVQALPVKQSIQYELHALDVIEMAGCQDHPAFTELQPDAGYQRAWLKKMMARLA